MCAHTITKKFVFYSENIMKNVFLICISQYSNTFFNWNLNTNKVPPSEISFPARYDIKKNKIVFSANEKL